MTFDPTNAQDRAHVRESLAVWHAWDLRPLAQVLQCEPTREAVTTALDVLDNADRPTLSPIDPAAYDWPELAKTLADDDKARAEARAREWWGE